LWLRDNVERLVQEDDQRVQVGSSCQYRKPTTLVKRLKSTLSLPFS
jgi:hypothetical protein